MENSFKKLRGRGIHKSFPSLAVKLCLSFTPSSALRLQRSGCSQSCWAGWEGVGVFLFVLLRVNTRIPVPPAALHSWMCWVSLKAFLRESQYQTLPIIFFLSSTVQKTAQFVPVEVFPRCFSSWGLCLDNDPLLSVRPTKEITQLWTELLTLICSFLGTCVENGGSEWFQTHYPATRSVCWG